MNIQYSADMGCMGKDEKEEENFMWNLFPEAWHSIATHVLSGN